MHLLIVYLIRALSVDVLQKIIEYLQLLLQNKEGWGAYCGRSDTINLNTFS